MDTQMNPRVSELIAFAETVVKNSQSGRYIQILGVEYWCWVRARAGKEYMRRWWECRMQRTYSTRWNCDCRCCKMAQWTICKWISLIESSKNIVPDTSSGSHSKVTRTLHFCFPNHRLYSIFSTHREKYIHANFHSYVSITISIW